ncbi:hydroxymethylglutaryl-CoA reductase, degradative [Lactobacillus johnsonii]|uniref:hydroxymethylglutaryl-CoA reductase, degradative n=1 Tax=Lactobacillus johnsonii TaxID=33959 RepID=UPI0028E2078D|nr:hydroxymethylglutaryl-CoA reductase, degradative [Lactobacillus johnsonii]MDT9605301.1 hydroxymethylglutaryl-CoA reductase, degradative [Lactobacillus johnsonii]
MKLEESSKKKFYQWLPEERRAFLTEKGIKLSEIDSETLERLDKLSENVIGQVRLPLGVLPKLIVNGKDYQVPMAVEEPSVVAAANHAAKIFNQNGGAVADSRRNGIYGQIVLEVADNFDLTRFTIEFPQLIKLANKKFASLVKHGGGVRKIEASQKGNLVFLRVLVDPAEAMGANKTNAILEFLGNELEKQPGIEQTLYAILSNYPTQLTSAKVSLSLDSVGGLKVAKKIVLLSQIGQADIYRAVTNNKGIMNGIDSVLVATGNDYRGVEAATAVLANKNGTYTSLSEWKIEEDKLVGMVTVPLAIGVVGGSIKARRDVQQSFSLLGSISAKELAQVIATTGLANNFSALLAISTKGIQAGHMKLQARNLVATLKANEDEKAMVLKKLQKSKRYTQEAAFKFLNEIRKDQK